jgi:hypothetical protein
MSRHRHRDALGDAGSHHVSGRGAAQVVEELLGHAGSPAGGGAFEVWESTMWGSDPEKSARLAQESYSRTLAKRSGANASSATRRIPTEDEIGDCMPHGGTVEDALASAARGQVAPDRASVHSRARGAVGWHRTQAGGLVGDLRVRHRGQHPQERRADLVAGRAYSDSQTVSS